MSWKGWQQQWDYPARKPRAARKEKGDNKNGGPAILGYDGSRVALSSSSSSFSSKQPKEMAADGEVQELKAIFMEVMKQTGNSDHPMFAKLKEDEDRDQIKKDQKELNLRRKAQKRVDTLKKQISTKEKLFQDWRKKMKQTIKEEEERYLKDMQQLREDLEKASRGEEEEAEMLSDVSSDAELAQLKRDKEVMAQQLAQADHRCREMFADNQDMHRKLDLLLNGLQQHKETVEIPDGLIPEAVTPPMVSSPSTTGLLPDGLRPFRRAKDKRDGPYTPRVAIKDGDKTGSDLESGQSRAKKTLRIQVKTEPEAGLDPLIKGVVHVEELE